METLRPTPPSPTNPALITFGEWLAPVTDLLRPHAGPLVLIGAILFLAVWSVLHLAPLSRS